MQKNGLIRKLKVISELMWSSNGKQKCAMHTLDNNSRSKGYQPMKFGRIIEDKVRNIFLQRSCWKWGEEIAQYSLFYEIKASGQHLSSNNQTVFKISCCWSSEILNFDFLEKGMEIVSPLHFKFQEMYSSCYILFTDRI